MGRKWNIFRGTIEQIVSFTVKLVFVAIIALLVYFVWTNFIKTAQSHVDKGASGVAQRTERQLGR